MEEHAEQRTSDAADAVNQMRLSKLPDPMSLQHLMTHLPKHPDCPDCQKAKLKHAHCRRVPPERKEKVTEFGQELSADTLLSKNEASTSLDGDRFAIIFTTKEQVGSRELRMAIGTYPQHGKHSGT